MSSQPVRPTGHHPRVYVEAMLFQEVVRRPVYMQVADQLRDAVLDGRLPAGADLPAERELCSQFGVSRTTVREALRALQARSLVVAISPTAPLRVADPEDVSSGPLRDTLGDLLRLGRVPLSDLIELQCALETSAVARAARRRPRADLGPVRQVLAEMTAPGVDVETFERADVQFHIELVIASGNEALQLVMFAVRGSIAVHMLEALHGLSDPDAALRRLGREHAAILDAIAGARADRAARLVRNHVMGFYQRTLGAVP